MGNGAKCVHRCGILRANRAKVGRGKIGNSRVFVTGSALVTLVTLVTVDWTGKNGRQKMCAERVTFSPKDGFVVTYVAAVLIGIARRGIMKSFKR